jgi:ribosomal protein L6P/L9E
VLRILKKEKRCRIGKQSVIAIPEGVTVDIKDNTIGTVKGKLGELNTRVFRN